MVRALDQDLPAQRLLPDATPEGVANRPQLTWTGFLPSASSGNSGRALQAYPCWAACRAIIPYLQILFALTPFAGDPGPPADGLGEGTNGFKPLFVTLKSF